MILTITIIIGSNKSTVQVVHRLLAGMLIATMYISSIHNWLEVGLASLNPLPANCVRGLLAATYNNPF